jgi:hypothetical protein
MEPVYRTNRKNNNERQTPTSQPGTRPARPEPGRYPCPDRPGAVPGHPASSARRRRHRRRHRHPLAEPPHPGFGIPGRRHRQQGTAEHRLERAGHRAGAPAAVDELPAPERRRRQRRRASGPAARPVARPDPGAGQRQAPPYLGRHQRQRHPGPRLGAGRPECDPAGRDRPHRSAARRRRRAIRFGCDRRRGQHHPEKRCRRRRGGNRLRPVRCRRRRAGDPARLERLQPRRPGLGAHLGGSGRPQRHQPRRSRPASAGRPAPGHR